MNVLKESFMRSRPAADSLMITRDVIGATHPPRGAGAHVANARSHTITLTRDQREHAKSNDCAEGMR